MKKLASVLFIFLLLSALLVACNPAAYRVTLDMGDGETTVTYVEGNQEYILPSAEREGYRLLGWIRKGVEDGEMLFPGDSVTVNSHVTYVAQWGEAEFIIRFVDGDKTVKTENLDTGDIPTPPEMSDKIVDDSTVKVFVGWTPEVVEVTEDAVYTAVYEERARTYPVTFVENDYVEFVSVDGEALTAEEREYGQSFSFMVNKIEGSTGKEIIVKCNGVEITPVDGVYTVPFYAETEITVSLSQEDVEYTVTFVNGTDVIKTETLIFGNMPTPPAMSDEIIDETTVNVFKGWTPEIEAVSGNQTYSAVYAAETRTYPIVFNSSYVDFLSSDNQIVTSAEREYNQEYSFTVSKHEGVNVQNMRVLWNGNEIEPVEGVYTVPFAESAEITVEGAQLAEYRLYFESSNVTYVTDMPESLTYGSTVTLFALGNEWYTDVAPVVTYAGKAIESSARQEVNGKEYYVYEFELDRNGTVSIKGVLDVVPVTYIDLNGEKFEFDWNITEGPIGMLCNGFYVNVYGSYLLDGTNKLYRLPYLYNSAYDTFIAVTADTLDSYFMTQKDGEAITQSLIDSPVYPVKGAENVYHMIYYADGEEGGSSTTSTTYPIGLMLPVGSSNLRFYVEGSTDGWLNTYFDRETEDYFANYVELYKTKDSRLQLTEGAVVYIAFDMADGVALPNLTNSATGEKINATTYTIGEEQVLCYRIEISKEGNWYQCDYDTLHYFTVKPPTEAQKDYLSFYNLHGNSFGESVAIRDGDTWTFRMSFNIKKAAVLDYFDRQSDGTYLIKEGMTPFEFTGDYVPEYSYYTNALGDYDTFLYIYITLENVQGDAGLEVNVGPRQADFAFMISEDYSIYIDDVLVSGDAGEIVTFPVSCNSEVRLVPREGMIFIDINSDSRIVYYYFKNGVKTSYQSYALGVASDNTYAYYEFNPYSFYTPVDTSEPMQFLDIMVASHVANHAAIACDSSSGLNNVTFPDGKAYGVTPDGTFSLKVQLPYGKYPVLYIEYADRPSDGDYAYRAKTVAQEGDYSTFTFEVSGVTSDVNWFIKLFPNEYEVTVHYGDITDIVMLTHGDILADSSELLKFFEGMQDGVFGKFTVMGWSTVEGGPENIIMVTGADDLWAVTSFAPYAVVFGDTGYGSLADALKDLDETAEGNLDIVWGYPQELTTGSYVIPAGVTLRLPYDSNAYGRKLAEASDKPSLFYPDNSLGTVMLTVVEGARLTVNGTVSVGGIVGYPQSAQPYQGHTSAKYAILQADGEINVEDGGLIDVNGYIVGEGRLTLYSGATSQLPFIVKDYRGGTNTANVYFSGCAPFNVYDMPNVQTECIIHYGASEVAYAMLYAAGGYNVALVEAIGETGIIRLNEGGYVVKHTTQIDNPRYDEDTKNYEPEKEFRTTVDVYGGGCDGAMQLNLGLTTLSTENVLLAIPYTYSVTLHDGDYTLYNMYKIMTGGSLKVAEDAKLTLAASTLDGKDYQGTIIVYEDTFAEDYENLSPLKNSKQLLYPVQPNGVQEGGKFIVNGTLEVRGRIGGEILCEVAGAKILVYSANANLTVTSREIAYFEGAATYTVTYEQTSAAFVNTESGKKYLAQGMILNSVEGGLW